MVMAPIDSTIPHRPAPTKPGAERRKKWAPKVRTGCITCRTRRIKCDEAKPACRRCESTDRLCGGYENVASPVWQRQAVLQIGKAPTAWRPAGIESSQEHDRIFYEFRTELARRVAQRVDPAFWIIDITLATQIHPVLWHASLATGSLYSRMRLLTSSNPPPGSMSQSQSYYIFAFRQYSESIKHLVKAVSQGTPSYGIKEMALMASLLFSGLCSMCGYIEEADVHTHNGIRLLHQWEFWRYQTDPTLDSHHEATIDVKAMVSLIIFIELLFIIRLQRMCYGSNDLVRSFASTDPEADIYFEFHPLLRAQLQDWAALSTTNDKSSSSGVWDYRDAYRQKFIAWKETISDTHSLDASDPSAPLVAKIFLNCINIQLHVDLDETELGWDQFYDEFQQAVDWAETVLEYRLQIGPLNLDPSAFSYSFSICDPLFFVGRECRDVQLRHRVTDMLRRWPQREPGWDSCLLAAIVQAISLTEENGLSERNSSENKCVCIPRKFICKAHRVKRYKVDCIMAETAELMLKTVDDIDKGRDWTIIQLRY